MYTNFRFNIPIALLNANEFGSQRENVREKLGCMLRLKWLVVIGHNYKNAKTDILQLYFKDLTFNF